MHLRLLAALTLPLALTACGDGLSKRNFSKQIDATLKDSHTCFALHNNAIDFPVRISVSPFGDNTAKNPILAGLVKGGYAKTQLVEHDVLEKVLVLDLTQKGKDAKVWDKERGVCVGRRGVAEVLNWSEPASGMGTLVTRINYKWEIAETPGWVEKEDFADVPGMTKPVEATAMAQKMSDGWQVINMEEEQRKMMKGLLP